MRLFTRALATLGLAGAALLIPATAAHADLGHEGVTVNIVNGSTGLCVTIAVSEASTNTVIIPPTTICI